MAALGRNLIPKSVRGCTVNAKSTSWRQFIALQEYLHIGHSQQYVSYSWKPGRHRGMGDRGAGLKVTKEGSSGRWMKRHLKDPYVSAAADSGAPSRAAYKLVEMDDRHNIISPGDRVLDLGAAPGGWSFVAARIVHGQKQKPPRRRKGRGVPSLPRPLSQTQLNKACGGWEGGDNRSEMRRDGAVVAVDLLEMDTLPGVEAIQGDFREPAVRHKIHEALACNSRSTANFPRTSMSTASGSDEQRSREPRQCPSDVGTSPRRQSCEPLADIQPPNDSLHRRQVDMVQAGVGRNEMGLDQRETDIISHSSSPSLVPLPPEPTRDFLEDMARSSDGTMNERREDGDESIATQESRLPRQRGGFTRANIVLSDMAPSFSGDRDIDQARVAELVLDALDACMGHREHRKEEAESGQAVDKQELEFTVNTQGGKGRKEGDVASPHEDEQSSTVSYSHLLSNDRSDQGTHDRGMLERGGTFLAKILAGSDEAEVKETAGKMFETVKIIKPQASRSSSAESYLLAKGFLLNIT